MGALIFSINVTIDGCCDHHEVIADDDLHCYAAELLDAADAVLLGRVTYQLFEKSWPAVAREKNGTPAEIGFACRLDDKRKYVVSNTLGEVQWKNAVILKEELSQEVARLKKEHWRKLVVFGSPGLAAALSRLGLIDEYQLLIQPMLAGHGPKLFQDIRKADLKFTETRRFESGVVMLRYLRE
jgi:dihydrofolate reductase